MKLSFRTLSKRLLILISFCVLGVVPLAAQDDAEAAYQKALRFIEEARVKEARGLNFFGFGLEALPPEIGQLTSLVELNLGLNRLTVLPPEIGNLTHLESLYLAGNQLQTLPPEIGQLKNLRFFDLTSNQLTTLPPEIGQLKSLNMLMLTSNQLTTLPVEVGALSVRNITLEGNPLIFPSAEMRARDTQALLIYLREYHAVMVGRIVAAIAAGFGAIALLILAFRWRQRRGLGEKKKRL